MEQRGGFFRVLVALDYEFDPEGVSNNGGFSMDGLLKKRAKHPYRVLVVDDDDNVRDLLCSFSRKLGLEVCASVPDGSDAVDFVSREDTEVDIILLDLVMKKLHGNVALPIIKSRKPHSKVIVISAFFMEYNSHFLANLGADGFLEKPFTYQGFASAVADVSPSSPSKHDRDLPGKGTRLITI